MTEDRFTALCEERMYQGLQEYRGGDASLPFDGDPIECGIEEAADLRNYAIHALDSETITAFEAGEIIKAARLAYAVLESVTQRVGDGVVIGERQPAGVQDLIDDYRRAPGGGDGMIDAERSRCRDCFYWAKDINNVPVCFAEPIPVERSGSAIVCRGFELMPNPQELDE